MSNETNKSPIDFLIKQKQKWGMIILDDLQQAKEMEKSKAFEIFKAGQDSMEEGGKGFEQWYEQTHEGGKQISITFQILYDMIFFIEESTTDINEQFGGCTNLEKLIESNEMPELYYKLVELQRKIPR